MPFYDDSGKEVTSDDVRAHFEPPPTVPNMPGEVAGNVVKQIGKIIPRVGTQVGGAEVGGALGALTPIPGGAAIGAGIGGGIGNIIGSKLPSAIGGDPTESTLGAFTMGAVPEAGARGLASLAEKRAATKAAEAAHDAIVGALDKGPMPAEAAGATASAMGRRSLARPPVMTGEALTDATNSLRSDILDPINATRRKLGEPIGKAYDALKGNENRLTPEEASDLSDAAKDVQDSMLAPYPKAKGILNRIKKFGQPETPIGALLKKDAQALQEMGGGELAQRAAPTAESLRLQNYTEAQIEKILGGEEARKPPTLDELRELRQINNQVLRSAKGGDAHAALGLQQALDEHLMPHLPEGISRDRELYRGFMNRFPWRDINKINELGTPRQLGDYVFGGTPERTAEIIEGASPKGREALKQALIDRALNANNPDLPLDQQVKSVRGALTPYIANGTADKLFGKAGVDELRQVFYAPEHIAQMKQIIATPEAKDVFVKETANLLRTGDAKKLNAVEQGFEKLVQSLPAPERARFETPPVPGAEMPVLPSGQEALQTGLTPGPSKIGPAMARRAQFTGPYAAGRAVMGSPAFAAAQLMAMAGIATTSAGYRALMENGGASMAAKLYASPSGRAVARTMIESLAAIGTQGINQATKDQSQ